MLEAPVTTWLLAILFVAMATMIAGLFDKQRNVAVELRAMRPMLVAAEWTACKNLRHDGGHKADEGPHQRRIGEGRRSPKRRVPEVLVVHVDLIRRPPICARRRTARGPPDVARENLRARDDND
jgi:hypothetical protein